MERSPQRTLSTLTQKEKQRACGQKKLEVPQTGILTWQNLLNLPARHLQGDANHIWRGMNSTPPWSQPQDEKVTIFSLESCHVVVVGQQLPYSTLRWPLLRAWCGVSMDRVGLECHMSGPRCCLAEGPGQATRWQEAMPRREHPAPEG